jgi:HEPN domain-containing protein
MTGQPDPARLREMVRLWLDHADGDLAIATNALETMEACPHHLVAFHAQQSAEKCIKALLLSRLVDFPFTHDLSVLLDKIKFPLPDPAMRALGEAISLTPYAAATRYPQPNAEVGEQEARRAVDCAARVRETVLGILAPDLKR